MDPIVVAVEEEEAVYRAAVSVKISAIEAQLRWYEEEIRELRRRLDELDKENKI